MSQSDQSNQQHNHNESSNLQNQGEGSAQLDLESSPRSLEFTDHTTQSSRSMSKHKSSGSFLNKSLAAGFILGFLIFWGSGKFLSRDSEVEQKEQEIAQESSTSQDRAVTTTLVQNSLVNRIIEVAGTVESADLVTVIAEVNGIPIQEVLVKEGSQVKRGQILAKLKDENLKTEYLEATARVDQFSARLAELQAGTRSEEIVRAEQRVKSANARLVRAKSDLDLANKRIAPNQSLANAGAISRDRLDEILNQAQNSRAQLNEAQANLDEISQELSQLRAGNVPAIISQARAELSQAQAQEQLAAVQLENTHIKAVTNGVIAQKNVQVGDVTSANQNLFTIIENGNLELRLQVPETDLSKLKVGQIVEIGKDNPNFAAIKSQIKSINPLVDSDSRQAIVKVDLPSQNQFKPGMFLNASIIVANTQSHTVPIKALLPQNDGKAIVFVLQPDQTVKARSVSLGNIVDKNRMEVLTGLQSDEQIILKGVSYLKDGDSVNISSELIKSVK